MANVTLRGARTIADRKPDHDVHECRFVPIDFETEATFLYDYVVAPTQFRWIEWNREHATKHGCTIPEIESVVRNAGHGFPRKRDRKKWLVIGRGTGGRMIRVIYVLDSDGAAFVIHAMPVITRRRR